MYINSSYYLPYQSYQNYNSISGLRTTQNPIQSYHSYSPNFMGGGLLSDALKPMNSMLSSARIASDSAKSLSSSLTSDRSAFSSDVRALTAIAKDGATLKNYTIQIDKVATVQKNSSNTLNKTSITSINAGTNRFSITMGSKTTSLNVNIVSTDTNEQALTKIKNTINEADLGVKSNLITDSVSGTVKLELTSDKTGTDHQFTIQDESGNAISSTGLNNVSSVAENGVYRIDGGTAKTTQTNTILLDNGKVSATMLKATSAEVKLSITHDPKQIVDEVKNFIGDYNSFIDRVADSSGYLNSQVVRSVKNILPHYRLDQLSDLGITKSADGFLRVDETKLTNHLTNHFDDAKRTLDSMVNSTKSVADRLTALPTQSLFDRNLLSYQRYSMYQSSLQSYFPLMAGMFLNQTY